jgi:hypothetical protein
MIEPCCACGAAKSEPYPVLFHGTSSNVPVCERCRPYVEMVVTKKDFLHNYVKFLGVSEFDRFPASDDVLCGIGHGVLPDLPAKFTNFELLCKFIGAQIQSLLKD